MTAETPGMIGARVHRVEDDRLTTGGARYLDDLTPPQTLHLRFVRSPYARARIKGVRLGVYDPLPKDAIVLTGDDFEGMGIQSDSGGGNWQASLQPVLAMGEVRYVGEPVVAVLHPDPYVAEDAAECVTVDYEPLQPVIDLRDALRADSPLVHEGWRDNVFVRRRRSFGDIDASRARSTRTIRIVTRTNRQAGVPLENRGCLAVADISGGGITLWSSTQMPHVVRTYVATALDIPEQSLRVVAPDVGGGFGIKGHVFCEEVFVTALALRLKRPVKWVEDRAEHLISSIHARDHSHRLEAYIDETGRIHGLRAQIIVDAGAYSVFPWTAGSDSGMVPKVMLGPYDIQDVEWDDLAIATNKCPLGTYRGVGRPSATFSIERLIETIAQELDLNAAEVRRTNIVTTFPYRAAVGVVYDSGSYRETLDAVCNVLDGAGSPPAIETSQKRYRRGVGLALFNEQTAHGTPDFELRGSPIETGYESATIEIGPDGSVTVFTGMQSHGQGLQTTLAQVVAQELGVAFDSVAVVHGDTANSPYCVGTWGSRGAALGGGAVAKGSRVLRAKILRIAAGQLEIDEGDLEIDGGIISPKSVPGISLTIGEIAYIANRRAAKLPAGETPGLVETTFLDGPERGTFSNACHGVEVRVDTWTGHVRLERYVVAEDCGTMINPTIVEGQIQGGVAQGIGSALLEEFIYSSDGQPQTSTFMNYLLPTTMDVPDLEIHHFDSPSPWTENGIKGMGEAGAIGPMAAIANAISQALGKQLYETPLSPERLLRQQCDNSAYLSWEYWSQAKTLEDFWIEKEAAQK